MRNLEIVLLLANLILLMGICLLRRWRGGKWEYGLLLLVFLWLAHLGFEGWRWQMVPAYGVVLYFLGFPIGCWLKRKEFTLDPPVEMRMVVFFVLLLSGVLSWSLPVFHLPDPDGPYKVGTRGMVWVDKIRPDMFSMNYRELYVKIWYPAEPAAGATRENYLSEYLDDLKTLLHVKYDVPHFVFNHFALVQSHAYRDAPIASGQAAYPVLLFSHAVSSINSQSTFLMEELASQGFIVAAINHTHIASLSAFPNLQAPFKIPGGLMLGQIRETMLGDVSFVLNQLEQLNRVDDVFKNRLDLDHVGIIGHSFGGLIAFYACQTDSRVKAGVNLNGKYSLNDFLEPISKPFIVIGSSYEEPLNRTVPSSPNLFPLNYRKVFLNISHLLMCLKVAAQNN